MLSRYLKILPVMTLIALGACATTADVRDQARPAADSSTKAAEAEAPSKEAEELVNTLKWSTASEVENFGFDIYRSTSEDGPFEKMTKEPLPGAGTIDEPQSYVWKDDSIKPGVDYYYYIESISYAGVRERFSPIIKAPAKHLSQS